MDALTKYENNQIETMIQEIKGNPSTIQQFAIEATHLMSATQSRLDEYQNSGFFKRLWFAISGKNSAMTRATQADLLKIQNFSLSFLQALYNKNMLMTQTISLINNELKVIRYELIDIKDAIHNSNHTFDNQISMVADKLKVIQSRFAHKLSRQNNQIQLHDWHIKFYSRVRDYEDYPLIFMLAIVFDCYETIRREHVSLWSVRPKDELAAAFANRKINQDKETSVQDFFGDLLSEIKKIGYSKFQPLVPSVFFNPKEKTSIQNIFVDFCWFVQTMKDWNDKEPFDNAGIFRKPFSNFKDYFVKQILKSPNIRFSYLEIADTLLSGTLLSLNRKLKHAHSAHNRQSALPNNRYSQRQLPQHDTQAVSSSPNVKVFGYIIEKNNYGVYVDIGNNRKGHLESKYFSLEEFRSISEGDMLEIADTNTVNKDGFSEFSLVRIVRLQYQPKQTLVFPQLTNVCYDRSSFTEWTTIEREEK